MLDLTPDVVYGPLIALMFVLSGIALISHQKSMPRPVMWSLLYLLYLAALVFHQMFLADNGEPSVALHGFAALALPILTYIVAVRSTSEARARALHLVVGPLLGASAVISVLYYFFDFTLWGLVQHHVYTDEIYSNDAIDRRAIGLLSSPQSHALSMVVLLVIAVTGRERWPRLSLVLGMLSVIGGLLSGSKAFLLGTLIIAAVRLPRTLILLVMLPLICLGWVTSELLTDSGLRALSLLSAAQNVDDYTATPLWAAALNYTSDPLRLLTGLGLGVMGALSEALEESPLDFSSTESYLLQIAVEVGLVGLLMFGIIIWTSLNQRAASQTPAIRMVPPALLLAVLVNAIFTPALYGFGNAALLGLLLAHTRRT